MRKTDPTPYGTNAGKLKNANASFTKVGGLLARRKIGQNEKISPILSTNPAKRAQTRYQSELKRLQTLTKDSIPDNLRSTAMPLLHNLAWQKVKLDEARHDLMGESLFIEYDNGGGQKGLREHPGFAAYNRLFTTFQRGMKQLTDLMDYEADEVDELKAYFDESRIS